MNPPTLAACCGALMLMTAGCIGADDDGTDALDAASTDATSATDASAPDAAMAVTGVEPAPEPLLPVVVPLAWDGSMSTHATVCEWDHAGQCVSVPPGVELDNSLDPALPGTLVAASLTLTWEATSPLTEELAFVLMAMVETEDGMDHPFFVYVEGASPLVIEASDVDAPPEAMIHLWVGVPSLAPDPFWSGASTDQPFHVEGTLTAMPVDGETAGMGHEH